MKKEFTILNFNCIETKKNKNNIGVFSGYLSTYDKDRSDDVFMRGAFEESISRLKKNNRSIRMMYQHRSEHLIGEFPIDQVKEDKKGLFVVGNINLDVQKGRESFSLMRQGVLSDMSIGFTIKNINDIEFKKGIRYIKKAEIFEGSLVAEPANTEAQITEVKNNEKSKIINVLKELKQIKKLIK